jgi:hypothetical protein
MSKIYKWYIYKLLQGQFIERNCLSLILTVYYQQLICFLMILFVEGLGLSCPNSQIFIPKKFKNSVFFLKICAIFEEIFIQKPNDAQHASFLASLQLVSVDSIYSGYFYPVKDGRTRIFSR